MKLLFIVLIVLFTACQEKPEPELVMDEEQREYQQWVYQTLKAQGEDVRWENGMAVVYCSGTATCIVDSTDMADSSSIFMAQYDFDALVSRIDSLEKRIEELERTAFTQQ